MLLEKSVFARKIGMSPTWYLGTINDRKSVFYSNTLHTIADNLGMGFEIVDERIVFSDNTETCSRKSELIDIFDNLSTRDQKFILEFVRKFKE